jgi:hypothetical protein
MTSASGFDQDAVSSFKAEFVLPRQRLSFILVTPPRCCRRPHWIQQQGGTNLTCDHSDSTATYLPLPMPALRVDLFNNSAYYLNCQLLPVCAVISAARPGGAAHQHSIGYSREREGAGRLLRSSKASFRGAQWVTAAVLRNWLRAANQAWLVVPVRSRDA